MTKNTMIEAELSEVRLKVGDIVFPDDLERFLRAEGLVERSLSEGTRVFEKDEVGDAAYLLLDGRVAISRVGKDGRERRLAVLGPGNLFGEMALLDGSGRSARATALTDLRCIAISRQAFLELTARVPALNLWLLRLSTRRLRVLDRRNDEMERLQEVSARIIEGQEAERRRIGRDIHDGPAQCFADYIMRLQIVQKLLERDPSKAFEEIEELRDSLKEGLQKIRDLIHVLHPKELETYGLEEGLRRVLDKMSSSDDVAIEFRCRAEGESLPVALQTTIYCLVQEALNNIRKHAHAQNVRISLDEEGSDLLLEIADDGRGFDVKAVTESYCERESIGLVGMAERVALVQGKMHLEAAPGKGTRLRFRLPLETEKGK